MTGVQTPSVERGAVTKSQKGKKAFVERKVGECFQWKAHGQWRLMQFSVMTSKPLETVAQARDEKDDRLLPASHSKAKQTDGEGAKILKGIRQ